MNTLPVSVAVSVAVSVGWAVILVWRVDGVRNVIFAQARQAKELS